MFTGLSAFPLTPMDDTGAVVADEFGALVARLDASGVASVGILGSTGTYMFLSRSERRRAVEVAKASLTSVPLIVGIGALRTDEAVALAKDAQAAGADGVLMAPVSYNPLFEEEVAQHYETVAAATNLPLCIYNNPGTTRFAFSTSLIPRLAKMETIQAIKMPSPEGGNFASDLNALPDALEVGYSGDWDMTDALLAGARSFHSAIAGTLPAPLVALANACWSGDAGAARQQDAALTPLWDICKRQGSLRVASALAQEMGLITTSLPRPLMDLEGADRLIVQDILSTV